MLNAEAVHTQLSEFSLDHLNSGIHLYSSVSHPGTRGSLQEVSTVERESGVDGADSHTHAERVNTPKSHTLKWLGGQLLLCVFFFYHSNKKFFVLSLIFVLFCFFSF